MPPFPVQPEGLVASDGKSVVGVRVCLLDAGHINIFYMKSSCERNLCCNSTVIKPIINKPGVCAHEVSFLYLPNQSSDSSFI